MAGYSKREQNYRNPDVFTDYSIMPFGKFKGRQLQKVPADHLLWLYENNRAGRLKEYIEENLDVLQKQAQDKRV